MTKYITFSFSKVVLLDDGFIEENHQALNEVFQLLIEQKTTSERKVSTDSYIRNNWSVNIAGIFGTACLPPDSRWSSARVSLGPATRLCGVPFWE